MKVVIVNMNDGGGGAAIAAMRLMHALRKQNIEAKVLVLDKSTQDPYVISMGNNKWTQWKAYIYFLLEHLLVFLNNGFSKSDLFRVSLSYFGFDISKHPCIVEADIIHLHWVNKSFLSYSAIQKLVNLGKPVVWTMHDMWVATAMCHHARDCEKFKTTCDHCFYLHAKDWMSLTSRTYQSKKNIFAAHIPQLVCCSEWLQKRIAGSSILDTHSALVIPNPINIEIYAKKDKRISQAAFKLDPTQFHILFCAAKVTDDRKGLNYLIEALQILKQKYPHYFANMQVVVVGTANNELQALFPCQIRTPGFISDEQMMVTLYNAVDVFVTPSLDENLPNTIMEAMACGTPCIGFATGGIPEMITHKETGYIAKYQSAEDLANGIVWIFEHAEKCNLSQKSICKVQDLYAEQIVANQYVALYEQMQLQD
ncbi:MAG: glycosyltransferase [Bacteroidales bacterium]